MNIHQLILTKLEKDYKKGYISNMLLKNLLLKLPLEKVYAHCDIPCGIYDPRSAQIAAETVLKMTQKILEEPEPQDENSDAIRYTNSEVRYILVKEEHARKCKEEILVLWTDYFKPEHLEKNPELHDLIWKTAKLCSKVKQTVDESAAKELLESVNKISDIFHQTKK